MKNAVHYAVPQDGEIGLYINGVRHNLNFERSDSFSEVTMAVSIPVNSTGRLQYSASNQWINLDYIGYRQ